MAEIPWWPDDEPRGALTRAQIAEAALTILDGEGLAALSMRRLARELGVGTMSLYWYVRGREQVLAHAVDAVVADVGLPTGDLPWDERARHVSREFRRAVAAHPAVVPVLAGGTLAGPSLLRVQEALLAALRDAGLDDDDVAHAYFAFAGLITSFVFTVVTEATQPTTAEETWVAGYRLDALPADRYPHTVALASRLQASDLDERFEFALAALIDGLRARVAAVRPAVRGAGRP